jgi:flagellar basal body-associated protein FliL
MSLFLLAQVARDVTGGYDPRADDGSGSANIWVLIIVSVVLLAIAGAALHQWERIKERRPRSAAEREKDASYWEELGKKLERRD